MAFNWMRGKSLACAAHWLRRCLTAFARVARLQPVQRLRQLVDQFAELCVLFDVLSTIWAFFCVMPSMVAIA